MESIDIKTRDTQFSTVTMTVQKGMLSCVALVAQDVSLSVTPIVIPLSKAEATVLRDYLSAQLANEGV